MYKGEFLNGKRNGKGKEYDYEGNLIFEGEYLYRFKRKGKEYLNGKLEYEGEFKFNRKWNGKGYDKDRKVLYKLNNGKGKIIEYDKQGNIKFEGGYSNGKKNGK